MKKHISYINKPSMNLKELVSGWKARQEGSIKWIDCEYCNYQIVGRLEHDAMPEMGIHRLNCRAKKASKE